MVISVVMVGSGGWLMFFFCMWRGVVVCVMLGKLGCVFCCRFYGEGGSVVVGLSFVDYWL